VDTVCYQSIVYCVSRLYFSVFCTLTCFLVRADKSAGNRLSDLFPSCKVAPISSLFCIWCNLRFLQQQVVCDRCFDHVVGTHVWNSPAERGLTNSGWLWMDYFSVQRTVCCTAIVRIAGMRCLMLILFCFRWRHCWLCSWLATNDNQSATTILLP